MSSVAEKNLEARVCDLEMKMTEVCKAIGPGTRKEREAQSKRTNDFLELIITEQQRMASQQEVLTNDVAEIKVVVKDLTQKQIKSLFRTEQLLTRQDQTEHRLAIVERDIGAVKTDMDQVKSEITEIKEIQKQILARLG
ncbi:MAG: hypothetical protein ACPG5T_06580 [Endozoicomonas sp.]